MSTFNGWQAGVLSGLGAPESAQNLQFLNAWAAAEGGSASFNPLNTTQSASGATPYNSNNGNPVWNYPDANTGIQATVATLENGNYPTIVQGLLSGNPYASQYQSGISQQLQTWGTGSAFYTSGSTAVSNNSVANGNAAPAIAAVAQTTTNALKLLQNLILSSQVDILTKTIVLCGILILFGAIPQTSKFALWITLGALVLLMVQQDGTGPTNTTYVTNSNSAVGGVTASATYS